MKPSVALEANRPAVRQTAQRFKTLNPRVLGSVLRGEDKDGKVLLEAVIENIRHEGIRLSRLE